MQLQTYYRDSTLNDEAHLKPIICRKEAGKKFVTCLLYDNLKIPLCDGSTFMTSVRNSDYFSRFALQFAALFRDVDLNINQPSRLMKNGYEIC